MDLFPPAPPPQKPPVPPLATRVRPSRLEEVVGQEELLDPGRPLRVALDAGEIHSLILWGPPGSGKTTLARLFAANVGSPFVPFSAVLSGIKEVREVMSAAERHLRTTGRRTLVFVDEIHRFNRAQQDAFLPFVETGSIVLAGATTENPSFAINAALLSRLKVYLLKPLSEPALIVLLRRAIDHPRGFGGRLELADTEARRIASLASGDGRRALNTLELAAMMTAPGPDGVRRIAPETIHRAVDRETLVYDKSGEEHYNLISALHKSLRNSDPQASVYWLTRMLESGEDPRYMARRMIRFASEDVGTADPEALTVAVSALQAMQFLGMPEGNLALVQAAVYLATAPKSNAVNRAYASAVDAIREGHTKPVPLHLRNPETPLMEAIGYGEGYQYAHDFEGGITGMECLPPGLEGRRFYDPGAEGFEAVLGERMREWERKRQALLKKPS